MLTLICKIIWWLPIPLMLYSWPYSLTPKTNLNLILWEWYVGDPHFVRLVLWWVSSHADTIPNSWHIFQHRPYIEIKRVISHGSQIIKVHKKFVWQFVRVICRGNLSVFSQPASACASFSQSESFNRSRNSSNENFSKYLHWWQILISNLLARFPE